MPSTLLYDAVSLTAAKKLAGVPGRKTMVIISDGLDNGSHSHLEEAVKAVQTTDTIVYAICYESGFSGCSFLKDMAEPTGGRMFEAGRKMPLGENLRDYRSGAAQPVRAGLRVDEPGARRLVPEAHVRVLRRGLKVQTRKGYYALEGSIKKGGSEDPPLVAPWCDVVRICR